MPTKNDEHNATSWSCSFFVLCERLVDLRKVKPLEIHLFTRAHVELMSCFVNKLLGHLMKFQLLNLLTDMDVMYDLI